MTLYSAESIKIELTQEKDIYIYRIQNLKVTNNDNINQLTRISGKSFLVNPFGHYYHLLMDQLCQYEILRQKFPDLQCIMWDTNIHSAAFGENIESKTFSIILDQYGHNGHLYRPDTENYEFEEVIFIFDENRMIPQYVYEKALTSPPHWFFSELNDSYSQGARKLIVEGIKLLSKRLDGYKSSQDEIAQKLYISRKKQSAKLSKEIESWLLEESPSEDTLNKIKFFKDRVFEEEIALEQFFADKGFKVVYMEDNGWADQVWMASESTQIAGLSGTNLLNSVFCRPGTKVIEILVNERYSIDWEGVFKELDISTVQIDARGSKNVYPVLRELEKYFMSSTDDALA